MVVRCFDVLPLKPSNRSQVAMAMALDSYKNILSVSSGKRHLLTAFVSIFVFITLE